MAYSCIMLYKDLMVQTTATTFLEMILSWTQVARVTPDCMHSSYHTQTKLVEGQHQGCGAVMHAWAVLILVSL